MAYTYDDFIKAGNASGRMSRFTDADLEVTKTNPEYGLSMLQLMKDEDEASSADAKLLATSAQEQLRKNYGVDTSNYPSSFNYVMENDPNYQAFRKAYLWEGERATGDALAKAAAATGGVPSSYAVSAAAQAGNYYASQLADKVPELREVARQQHENDTAKYLQSIALKIEGQQLQDQQKVDNAWKTYNATGYATPEIAAILGVQEGWAPSIVQKVEENEGAGKTLTASMVTLLKDLYGDGYIRDKAKWEELVADYGQQALEDAGFSYYDVGYFTELVKGVYPTGGVSQEEYNLLLEWLDKSVLDAAGIYVVGGPQKPVPPPNNGTIGNRVRFQETIK